MFGKPIYIRLRYSKSIQNPGEVTIEARPITMFEQYEDTQRMTPGEAIKALILTAVTVALLKKAISLIF